MKSAKRWLCVLCSVILTVSLCGCSFTLPWQKEDEGSTDEVGGDVSGTTETEEVATGMVYAVGDTINAVDVIYPDLMKNVTALVFVVDNNMSETLECTEAGEFSVQVLVQYDDFTEWTGWFEYTVEGKSVQLPQELYQKLVSSNYEKEVVTLNDGTVYSLIYPPQSWGHLNVDLNNGRVDTFSVNGASINVSVLEAGQSPTSAALDETLMKAVVEAIMLREILSEGFTEDALVQKVIQYVYGIDPATFSQNGTNESDDTMLGIFGALLDPSNAAGSNSAMVQMMQNLVKSETSETGLFVYSTNGDAYPLMKVVQSFDGTQLLGMSSPFQYDVFYYATIEGGRTIKIEALETESGSAWSYKFRGHDEWNDADINNADRMAEIALAANVPDYSDTTFSNVSELMTWVRTLFVGESSLFEAAAGGGGLVDPVDYLDIAIVGDYTAVIPDDGSVDELDPDANVDEGEGDPEDTGVEVVTKKSYQQQHPGLFEWPESDIIYRRWVYTIDEETPYQGTIYLSDGTILQGTGGLNTWTGEFTPTEGFTTKTHVMRTASRQYDLSNESDNTYVINVGKSNSSTTSITKGDREYILASVSNGWVTTAKGTPVYGSWGNASSFEALPGNSYSNGGFIITPYNARIITGAGTNEYPYIVILECSGDYFAIYGDTSDVDINEMLYIADNIIKARDVEDGQQ